MRNIILISTITVFVASCGSQAENKEPVKAGRPVPVRIQSVQHTAGSANIESSGSLETDGQASLSFKTGGVIERIFVVEGERVRKGQLLATVKSTEISAQVQQVELGYEKALRDYQRLERLYADSVATLEQLQNAKTGLELSRRQVQQAGFNQQYSRIYAIADGFVIRKLKQEGELAEPGMPVLMIGTMSAAKRWVIRAGLSDREWAIVARGDSATVRLDAFPDRTFRARVIEKALAADPVTGVFEVKLAVDLADSEGAVGMFARMTIATGQRQEGIRIPYEALLEAQGSEGFVFATRDGKIAIRVPVRILSMNQDFVTITAGLDSIGQVIVSGSPYLTEGSPIQIIP